ncbi:MAG: hypothetical protein EBS01_04745 [Verrucomicrobia bacterium]|nr:hypothetical protein [Verrucomicrobiota bacterium]
MTRTSGDLTVEERIFGTEIDLPLVSTLGRFRAHWAQRLAWHSHENVELIFLQGGASSYDFPGLPQADLAGGQFLLVPAKTLHRGGQDIRMPSELCGIVLEPFSRKKVFAETSRRQADDGRSGGAPRIQPGADVRSFQKGDGDVSQRLLATAPRRVLQGTVIRDRSHCH